MQVVRIDVGHNFDPHFDPPQITRVLSGAAGNTPEFIQGMKGGLPPSGNMV